MDHPLIELHPGAGPQDDESRFWIREPIRRENETNFRPAVDRALRRLLGGAVLRASRLLELQPDCIAFNFKLLDPQSGRILEKEVKKLCDAIYDPGKRKVVDALSSRSILGVSALGQSQQQWLRSAFFNAVLTHGPSYLDELEVETADNMPSWFLALPFGLITGINIAPLENKAASRAKKKHDAHLFDEQLVQLFGRRGAETGAEFLEHVHTLRSNEQGTQELLRSETATRSSIDDLIRHIDNFDRELPPDIKDNQDIEVRVGAVSTRTVKGWSYQLSDLSYATTVTAARLVLADDGILTSFLQQSQNADDIVDARAAATAGGLAGAALSMGTASVPLTQLTMAQIVASVGSGSWPMMATISNPAGFIVGVGIAAVAGISYLRSRATSREAEQVRDVVAIIWEAQGLCEEISLFLRWLQTGSGDVHGLQRRGGKAIAKRWRAFGKKERESQMPREARASQPSRSCLPCFSEPSSLKKRRREDQVFRYLRARLQKHQREWQEWLHPSPEPSSDAFGYLYVAAFVLLCAQGPWSLHPRTRCAQVQARLWNMFVRNQLFSPRVRARHPTQFHITGSNADHGEHRSRGFSRRLARTNPPSQTPPYFARASRLLTSNTWCTQRQPSTRSHRQTRRGVWHHLSSRGRPDLRPKMHCGATFLIVGLAASPVSAWLFSSNPTSKPLTARHSYFRPSDEATGICQESSWAYGTRKRAQISDCVALADDLTARNGTYYVGNFDTSDYHVPVASHGSCTLGFSYLEQENGTEGFWAVGDKDVAGIVKEAVQRLGRNEMIAGVGTTLCQYDKSGMRYMVWRIWDASEG
ncbi:hypothetical protein PCL_00791 [Purpureocillium lilacinum]|uniref:Ecp2 effector protein-like domain-containing protein n=1 Tax=Purpureocillium lilacinum TaxID=33203 RepID=A0A2U3E5Y0_PURLI|nr:hypothetical protein PCL_00791 [Purpureocillium lilacinum]